ncbi:MAG: metal-dependent transcriptional regulator [Symbiobacteriia bacterium]
MQISPAMEDYLMAIYRSQGSGDRVATGQIARRLGVSAASTTAMFKRLAEEDLVQYQEYTGVSLTGSGQQLAADLVRRHRLAERFLTDVLGISLDQVDTMADRMEHALPPEVIDRFDTILQEPRTCPHGQPIPDKGGAVPDLQCRPLAALLIGEAGTIARVEEGDPELLRYLVEQGLVPGATVQIAGRHPVDDLVTLRLATGELVVGQRVVRALSVGEVPAQREPKLLT